MANENGIRPYRLTACTLKSIGELWGYDITNYPEWESRVYVSKNALETYKYWVGYKVPITKGMAIDIILDLITTGVKRG